MIARKTKCQNWTRHADTIAHKSEKMANLQTPPFQGGGKHLSKYSVVAEGIASGLGVHAEAVRALTDRDTRKQAPVGCVDGIHFGVITPGQPQHLAVCRDASHIGAASNCPFLDDLFRGEFDHGNAALVAVRYVKDL